MDSHAYLILSQARGLSKNSSAHYLGLDEDAYLIIGS